MNKDMLSKTLIMGIVLLFFGISITPTIGISNSFDDTTPPITTHTLDPPVPDGLNGWYVSDVNVTLNATDDISGVKEIKYRINGGSVQTITGDYGTFIMDDDGDDIEIEYWAIDNVENEETHHTFEVDIDLTVPYVNFDYFEFIEVENDTALVEFGATAIDDTSGMNRVEFYTYNGLFREIVYGFGPKYICETIIDYDISIRGLIINKNITEEYVTFLAVVVSVLTYNNTFTYLPHVTGYDNAGNNATDYTGLGPNPPVIKLFKWYNFTNDYEGYIGSYYIDADFKEYPTTGSIGPNNLFLDTNSLTNIISFHTLFLRLIERFPLLNLLLQRLRI